MTVTSEPVRTLDAARAAGRLPDPRPADQRPPVRLPRLRVVEPEAVGRHRRRRRLLPRVQRQRPSRHLHDRREGDRRLRGGPGQGRPVHQRARQPRGHLHPQRDRGDQPRRLLVGPPQHRPRRRDRPDRDGAPRQPRPVAAPRPGARRRPRVHPDHRRRHPPPRRPRGAPAPQAEARRVHPRLEHARARSTRSPRWSRWPMRPARSSWSMAPRPCRTCRSTSRRSAPTSMRSAATRCWRRWARARSGRGASCSRRCRRSCPAAR